MNYLSMVYRKTLSVILITFEETRKNKKFNVYWPFQMNNRHAFCFCISQSELFKCIYFYFPLIPFKCPMALSLNKSSVLKVTQFLISQCKKRRKLEEILLVQPTKENINTTFAQIFQESHFCRFVDLSNAMTDVKLL